MVEGIDILVSFKHQFIRAHENLVQHPSDIISNYRLNVECMYSICVEYRLYIGYEYSIVNITPYIKMMFICNKRSR